MAIFRPADLSAGGTITGNLTITGTFTVQGATTTITSTTTGTLTIDVTSTTAFVARKVNAGGNVFIVDTTNNLFTVHAGAAAITHALRTAAASECVFNEQAANIDVRTEGQTNANLIFVDASADSVGFGTATPGAVIDIARPAITSNAENISFRSSAVTQTITAAVTNARFNQFLLNTVTAGTAQTVTNAATLYVEGATAVAGAGPAAITNNYALWIDAGTARFDGGVLIGGAVGDARFIDEAIAFSAEVRMEPESGNNAARFRVAPGGTNTTSVISVANQSGTANASTMEFRVDAGTFIISTNNFGTPTTAINLFFINNGSADVDFRIATVSTANAINLDAGLLGGVGQLLFGAAAEASPTSYLVIDNPAFTAVASTQTSKLRIKNTNIITIPTGTTSIVSSINIAEPNLTATGTITNAVTAYIEAAPTEGTNNFSLWVDAGAVRFDGITRFTEVGFTAANGANDDIAIGDSMYVRITGPTAAFTITSIASPADGRIIILFNDTAQAMTIANQAASGTAANRIITLTGADEVTTGTGAVILIYSAANSRWIQLTLKA